MICVAHISDLHFGTEDPEVAEALVEDIQSHAPGLLAISGDLTQRARARQFRAAREYLRKFAAPKIIVPGNHDVPLYDVFRRFLAPYGRYRKFMSDELNPVFEDEEIVLLGVNTARSLTWKSGRISCEQIRAMEASLKSAGDERFKVVMTHHPFIPPPGDEVSGIDLVGRAAKAIPVMDAGEVDLLLAGHLHVGYNGDVRTYYPGTRRSMIVVQAGTAISKRRRNEPNGYNLLRLDRKQIHIEVRTWDSDKFTATKTVFYTLRRNEWVIEDP